MAVEESNPDSSGADKSAKVAQMIAGDRVVFAIKVWQEMDGPDTFGHTGDHGAFLIEEDEKLLIIDSTAKRPFFLRNGERFEEGMTVWSYNDGNLSEKKKDRVNILFKPNYLQNAG